MAATKNQKSRWMWFDGEMYQPYDDVTNNQIENAFLKGLDTIILNQGSYFGKYENKNVYFVIFDRSKSTYSQMNKNSFNSRKLKRETRADQNEDKDQDKYVERKQDINEYGINYEKGDEIEIMIDNKWVHGLIIKTQKLGNNFRNFKRNKIITVKYKNAKTLKDTEIILHGLRDKNKFRPMGTNKYSDHKFKFKYHNKNKNNDPKNAKHPAYYINRICLGCDGKGCTSNGNQQNICQKCKGTGNASLPCKKCNESGICTKKDSLIHTKCKGNGCNACNGSGRYPIYDIKCRGCKGTRKYKPKCNGCNGSGIFVSKYNNNAECINGYLLNVLKPFVPQRNKLTPHGNVGKATTKRLYHVTDYQGAVGIKETGVMYRGNDGSYGGGIYFAQSALKAASKARHKGYLLICDVFIGKVLNKNNVNVDMDFDTLHLMGYDSIKTNWKGNGVEYVVYHWDQVWVHIVLPFEKIDFSRLN